MAGLPLQVTLARVLPQAEVASRIRHDLRGGMRPSLEGLGAPSPVPADGPAGYLEVINSARAGLGEFDSFITTLVTASRRIAMIEVGGQPRGTGVLVGPDLLLTAAHVIDEEAPTAVSAVFDFFPDPPRSRAETGVRITISARVAGSPPSPAERAGSRDDWNAPLECLDFALLQLSTPQPERGYYELSDEPYGFDQVPMLYIPQHPLGRFQAYTEIKDPPRVNPAGSRVRYRGNTEPGSSGSPVIDPQGRLVALHHYSVPRNNQGVPISAIAASLRPDQYADRLTGAPSNPATPPVDPEAHLIDELQGVAAIDRDLLRHHICGMTGANGRRALVITGGRRAGISFSYDLLSSVASTRADMDVLRIDLRPYVRLSIEERCWGIVEAVAIGLALCNLAELPAQDARRLIGIQQWFARELRGNPSQQWIFFDSLDDAVVLQQGGVTEFLHAMLGLTRDAQLRLRVVLAGREADVVAAEYVRRAERDVIAPVDEQDAKQWVRNRAARHGCALDEDDLTREMSALFPDGGPVPPTDEIAWRLPVVAHRLLAREG